MALAKSEGYKKMRIEIPRSILAGLIGIFILTVFGCATAPITSYRNYTLKITSNPSDAEVYLNDKYVGRTPCSNVPIFVAYDISDSYFEPYIVTKVLKERHVLRVSKKGYKDAVEQIGFIKKNSWDTNPSPLKTDYHFDLEKKDKE